MSEARWAEYDTTPERIESALRELLRERHAVDQTLVPARVLNLIVIADREWRGEVANRLERIGRYNPSRTILCAVQDGRTTIDARAVVTGDESADGTVGILREHVEMDIGDRHLRRIDSIIDPVIVSDLPTVVWSPHSRDEAVAALLGLTDVILIDTDDPAHFDGPGAALTRASELLAEDVYVVDLAWLRTTPWRERLASAFEEPSRRAALGRLKRVYVRYQAGSIVSGLLLCGWLASRLGWSLGPLESDPAGVQRSIARREDGAGSVTIEFVPVDQGVRGIAGVTVSGADGFSLSLDRGRGGLTAREQRASSRPREWRVLGASRGEGGILGEGVRQALLRDKTYGPALEAARRFAP